jgi:hypothetical protein
MFSRVCGGGSFVVTGQEIAARSRKGPPRQCRAGQKGGFDATR